MKLGGERSGADVPGSDALRRAAASALERGLAFVEAHGDDFTRLCSHALLEAVPAERCVEHISGLQREDGSFPPLGLAAAGSYALAEQAAEGLPGDLLGSLEALVALADLRCLERPCVERAAVFLAGVQGEDGSWGPADWAPERRLFATGMLAGLLGRTRAVRPHVLDHAAEFMTAMWAPERIEGRRFCTLVAFGIFFSSVAHDLADGALQWLGRELERGYRRRSYDAAETLCVLLHCDAMALPGATLPPGELLHAVLGEQARDGGFAELAFAGVRARVAPTLDCMRGIIRLCRVI